MTRKARPLYHVFYTAALFDPPTVMQSEAAFLSFWDGNVRNILQSPLPGGIPKRGTRRHTGTLAKRPDFEFLLADVSVLGGKRRLL